MNVKIKNDSCNSISFIIKLILNIIGLILLTHTSIDFHSLKEVIFLILADILFNTKVNVKYK